MWSFVVSPRARSRSGSACVAALGVLGIGLALCVCAVAQRQQLPYLQPSRNSIFTQFDFAQMYFDQQARDAAQSTVVHPPDQKMEDSGAVSMLDLAAPGKAVQQYNRALSYLKEHDSKDSLRALKKAIALYPSFVSAHNLTGIIYLDQHEDALAKNEFETAAKLDDHFVGCFLNLGMMAFWSNDYASADSNLEKAAALSPDNPAILGALAFAQNGNHQYAETLRTVERIQKLDHHGNANVHYVAAAAAESLRDFETMKRELTTFIAEAPSDPLVPVARKYLDTLAHRQNQVQQTQSSAVILQQSADSASMVPSFANSEHLRAELNTVADSPDADTCNHCGSVPGPNPASAPGNHPAPAPTYTSWDKVFTIHQAVDETALFFSVSRNGHMVSDLSPADIQIRDDNKPPDRILQFIPQSKLPLRLGLLIDTSGSVEHRISFEKEAAEKFMERVLNPQSDLAFVAGFNKDVVVSQDFTNDPTALANGIRNLPRVGDGTSVFDSILFACWKLAAYPDEGRAARVLVILTDGEDNASKKSLQQSIDEAEASGVTIYAINTSENIGFPTDANKILKLLAERSGGESISPSDIRAVVRYLTQLPDVIRSRYLVAYKPADFIANGKYRTVRVAATKDGKQLQVHVRKGYYARTAEGQTTTIANGAGGK